MGEESGYLDEQKYPREGVEVWNLLPADFMQYSSSVYATREEVYYECDSTDDGEDTER